MEKENWGNLKDEGSERPSGVSVDETAGVSDERWAIAAAVAIGTESSII